MIQLMRIMQAGSRNFFRNMWLSIAATAVMIVTLTVVLISFISNWALTSTVNGVIEKLDVSVSLNDSVTPAQVKELRGGLEALPNVKSVSYITKAQALAEFRRTNAADPKLLAAVTDTDNPLPQSLAVKAASAGRLDNIVEYIKLPKYQSLLAAKDPISYTGKNKRTIDSIVGGSNFLKRLGLIASGLFVVIAILIIFNTIRMAIFTRRDEIEIMKLVGATPWFIRGPFLFEAALYGIIAAIVACVFCYTVLLSLGRHISYIDIAATVGFFRTYPVLVAAGALLLGVAIGAFSSLLAMGRYLKV